MIDQPDQRLHRIHFFHTGDLDSACSGLCGVVFDGIEHKPCSGSFEKETIASDEALIETFKGLDVVPTARLPPPGAEDKSPESLQAAERTHSGASELPVVSFGSRNTWTSSDSQEKKLCGMRRRVFSILLGILYTFDYRSCYCWWSDRWNAIREDLK